MKQMTSLQGDETVCGQAESGIMTMCPKDNGYIKMNVGKELEPTVRAIVSLSPASLQLVSSLVRQLAEREGIDVGTQSASRISCPADGVPLWVAKMTQESMSPGTIRVYQSTTRMLLALCPTPSHLDIQGWLAQRLKTKSAARVSTDRKALRSLFSFLKAEGLWPVDPTERIKGIKVPRHSEEPPTLEDVCRLLEYDGRDANSTQKFVTMTRMIATTGLRIDEACSLRKDCVLFSKHELRVVGKGRKERIVPTVPAAEILLREWLDSHKDASPFVFPGGGKKGHWDDSCYRKALRRACDDFGMKNFHPHTLRHFFATFMLQHGAKLEVVSKILGHASVGTTSDIYRHVLGGEMHDATNQFAPFSPNQLRLADPRIIEGEVKELPNGNTKTD